MKALRSDSFLVRVAYWGVEDNEIPDRTSLCSFFWRFVYGGISMIVEAVILVFVGVVVSVLAFVVAGYRITLVNNKLDIVPIKRWPKLSGEHVMPLYVAFGVLCVWLVVSIGTWIFHAMEATATSVLVSPWTGTALLSVLGITLIVLIWRSPVGQLTRSYAEAVKGRFCLLIEIQKVTETTV